MLNAQIKKFYCIRSAIELFDRSKQKNCQKNAIKTTELEKTNTSNICDTK